MLGPNDYPFAVVGERCLIRADPPRKKTIGGIELPAGSQLRPFTGTVRDAGLQARDKMHDHGIKIGDRVWFGKFAGVVEEWDHIIEGDHTLPDDAYDWAFESAEPGEVTKYVCRKTGAVRAIEPFVVLNVDDLLASQELAERLRAGQVEYMKGAAVDTGRVQHVVVERSVSANGHA